MSKQAVAVQDQATKDQVAALAQAADKVQQQILAQTANASTGSPGDTLPGSKSHLLQKMMFRPSYVLLRELLRGRPGLKTAGVHLLPHC